jgi:Xaa-Pro aminopeptidase
MQALPRDAGKGPSGRRFLMYSRRSFLRQATIGATVPLLAGEALAQRSAEAPSSASVSTPPSIARLPSMKDRAKPITVEERRERLEKARRLMAENQMGALMLAGGTSLDYFAGIRWWLSERLFAMLLPANGEPFFVCPAFERDRAEEQIKQGPAGTSAELRLWEEDESPYEKVAQGLRERGVATGRLGVEETVRFVFSDGVAKAAPALALASGTPVTAGCRMHKSAHEIELMRLAAEVTILAYEAAWRALKPGMTQHDFADLVSAAHRQLGFEGGAEIQVGPYSALPHGSIEPQTIREDTILLMDGGCQVEGYWSDISRTFVLGKPTDKMRRVFDIVHQAQTIALRTARPDLPCEVVDTAARNVIVTAGYGPGYKYFTHRLGHGMGMDGHEWPYLVRGDEMPMAANMVFSDEPGIYIRGEFGVRLEDDMHITERGAELFTRQSPSLEEPFAMA